MNYWDKKLVREQIDSKLYKVKTLLSISSFENGWIKILREALSMSTYELGKRAGLTQSRISRIENSEIDGDLKLSTLRKIAESMNMKFVYAFVPETSLEEMTRQQARKIALKRIAKLNHTMLLEAQELEQKQKDQALEDMVQKILQNPPKDFWLQ